METVDVRRVERAIIRFGCQGVRINAHMPATTLVAIAAACAISLTGCTSESAMLTNDAGQSVQCKNEGWGWIGAPVAMANQSSCIKKAQAAGYREPGSGSASPERPNHSSLGLAFPAGWQTLGLTDVQRRNGAAIAARNETSDSWVMVSSANSATITDRDEYIASRRADMESRLKEPIHSDIQAISVNGMSAKRFEVTGTATDGARHSYLYTAIFGQSEVVVVNAWTSAPNFETQKGSLRELADWVSGIR
jgi:hypothetical protein